MFFAPKNICILTPRGLLFNNYNIVVIYFRGLKLLDIVLSFVLDYWYMLSILIFHVAAVIFILLRRRGDPAGAAIWILIILLAPVVGVLAFLFLGIHRLKHTSELITHSSDKLDRAHHRKFAAQLKRLETHMDRFRTPDGDDKDRMLSNLYPDSASVSGNHIEMLCDGVTAYPRMLEDIRQAKHCIRLQSFIFAADTVGKEILSALEERAANGVDVKVIFDSVGSFPSFFKLKYHAYRHKFGDRFQMRPFSPLNLLAPWRFQLRNHRKLLVIDGSVAYSGGINISEDNERLESVPANRYVHDLHCRITGPVVYDFTRLFFANWAYTTRRKLHQGQAVDADFTCPEPVGEAVVRALASAPFEDMPGKFEVFATAAQTAQKSLTILTPYFVPGEAFIALLELAVARGVEVKIIVPADNNHILVDWAARSFYPRLLNHGVKIFLKQGIFSHIKALLVDEKWGLMGSSNCDNRSFNLNFELDFTFEKSPFIEVIKSRVEQELSESNELTLVKLKRKEKWYRVLAENTCALFSPFL